MVVQYTSSRGSKAFKIGAALVAIVGAISISNVWKGLRDAGRAMAGSPISTAMLALGFLLVVVAFRDTWLGWFGWMGPHRA